MIAKRFRESGTNPAFSAISRRSRRKGGKKAEMKNPLRV
jgi:hypothetical protein